MGFSDNTLHPHEEAGGHVKIYFAGSIRGGRNDVQIYQTLITWLGKYGEVLTEHVGNPALSIAGDDGPNDRFIHDRDMAWLKSCNIVVAEVTVPSLGVGYELGWATALKKSVLCLHRSMETSPLSAMISGSPEIQTASYSSMNEAKDILDNFITMQKNKGIHP
ncbi:MAG: nucleoside 2-deoxyribosyltransferase [Syntrophaceae bacterium]|jgi:2'-deoxynucleoside 5'-phosphate N-hydrolase|nr:nucleoside 2-deoxyribosyltransferase [Syntrophaceae bacterium]